PQAALPDGALLRKGLDLPEVSELDLMRHYVRLSQLNWAVDIGFYPLGSCTMKYNPKVNEAAARLPGFARTHPYQDVHIVQGNLRLLYELQEMLKEIAGFAGMSLQPSAGAHGELTGVLIMRAYHVARGEGQRRRIIVPDSAHGTNPATTNMAGLEVVEVPSDARGNVDLGALEAVCDETVCGLMLTNPNTLGLFEEQLPAVLDMVHGCGGLVYGDGANMNAIMGITRPGDLGIDVMHFNLHKTFSTPHGGGGPGAGPVGVAAHLVPFLPGPVVALCSCEEAGCPCDEEEGTYYHLVMPEKSIGRVKGFYGNFGVLVRAYAYIRTLGAAGLCEASEMAVLNANYLKSQMADVLPASHDRTHMHEFVEKGVFANAPDVHALDIAKRLIDYGFHPPTNYFPLIVPEALMIEPTETESKETLDAFAAAMRAIQKEAEEEPELLHEAPHNAPLRRLDELQAARNPILRWQGE
ncbi:MAG: aminomethyl-transferring glycine dehydrogenase subunit GcvPB, partial [Anaerolineae bacterium]